MAGGTGRATILLAAAVALVVAAGVMTGLAVAWAQQDPATPAITIEAFQFKPRTLEARIDTRVVWINDDDVTHTATSGIPERRTDLFNATLDGKGTRFGFTFARTGTFEYFCTRHPHMRGTVTIR